MTLNLGSSRHLPDTGLTRAPLCDCQCWLAPPVQVNSSTGHLLGISVAVDVHALAVDLDRPVRLHGPGLLRAAVAGPHHHWTVILAESPLSMSIWPCGNQRRSASLCWRPPGDRGALAPESLGGVRDDAWTRVDGGAVAASLGDGAASRAGRFVARRAYPDTSRWRCSRLGVPPSRLVGAVQEDGGGGSYQETALKRQRVACGPI